MTPQLSETIPCGRSSKLTYDVLSATFTSGTTRFTPVT